MTTRLCRTKINPKVGLRKYYGPLLVTRSCPRVAEVAAVFQMIADEYAQRGQPLPADTTEIAHAWRARDEFRRVARKLGFQ
jgi:hypothetical protein